MATARKSGRVKFPRSLDRELRKKRRPNSRREHRQERSVVNFSFTWRHMDGSVVTFSPDGWTSSDPEKAAWLNAMSRLTSSEPVAPPLIRIWLAEECQLVEVHRPER
jgi:hypothetical protein